MARVLVNYIYHSDKDEFEVLKGSYVFADIKVAILDTDDLIRKPLVVNIKGNPTIVDREAYELNNKKFKLEANEKGKVFESDKGVEVWLPKDTDIKKLRFINGQLVMVDKEDTKKGE